MKCRKFKHTTISLGGVSGNYYYNNTGLINVGKHYNGSGKESFGGAEDWPHISLGASFPTNTPIYKVKAIAKELADVLKKHGFK